MVHAACPSPVQEQPWNQWVADGRIPYAGITVHVANRLYVATTPNSQTYPGPGTIGTLLKTNKSSHGEVIYPLIRSPAQSCALKFMAVRSDAGTIQNIPAPPDGV
jgi:hypothetical protein